jgi:uncharacterized membrane protein
MNGKSTQTSPAEPAGTPGTDKTSTRADRRITTRQIAIAGICGATGLVLAFTPLGLIPVPNLAGAATTLHIPAIVAGVFGGPMVGAFTGLILAISSWILYSGQFLTFAGGNLLVALLAAFLPRLLIGVVAYYTFKVFSLQGTKKIFARVIGAFTFGFLALGILYLAGSPTLRVEWWLTALHVVPIVLGMLVGPIGGGLTGLLMGGGIWLLQSTAILSISGGNVVASVLWVFLPLLVMGVLGYYSSRLFCSSWGGPLFAALAGTLTNTVGVLGIIYIFGDSAMRPALIPIILLNPIVELGLAIVVITPLVAGLRKELQYAFRR